MTETKKTAQAVKKSPYASFRARDKKSTSQAYELTLLLRSDASSLDVKDFFDLLKAKLTHDSTVIEKTEYWGLRTLAYKIKKNKKAHFYSLQFYGTSSVNDEVEAFLKVNTLCIRYLLLKIHELEKNKPSLLLVNLQKDIESGSVAFDEKYIVKLSN